MTGRPRIRERRANILRFVQERGPVSVREVAVSVLGGTGATRTSSRQVAYMVLRGLMLDGLVVRSAKKFGDNWGHVYAAKKPEGETS